MTPANGSCRTAADAARHYLRAGIQTVPLARHGKKPWSFKSDRPLDGWETLELTNEDIDALFPNDSNIGARLGAPSGGLVDADLDCAEARRAAPILLPATGMVGGRESAPDSHRFFVTDNPPAKAAIEFRDPTSTDLGTNLMLELRSTGGQTVVAPSIYGSDPAKGHLVAEPFIWHKHGAPARVDVDVLMTTVKAVAAASLLGRHWHRSGRHAAALALAGGLRRANVPVEDAERFVRAVCAAANDEEPHDRVSCVRTTYEKPTGEYTVGWPRLIDLLGQHGQRIIAAVTGWLGIQPTAPRPSTAPGTAPTQSTPPFRPLPEWKPFPVEHLPATLREFVGTVSSAMRCDTSYVALPVLSVCAGMIGTTRTIALKKSWHEPVMVWTAVVGESGTLKTPPYRRAIAPVVAMQTEHIRQYVEAAREYRSELRQYERDKKKAGANCDPGDPPTEPVCTRIYSRDTTVEAPAEIISANRDRFLVGRDELSGWLASFNQYKSKGGSDLANWLELHGLGTLCVDRKTGEQRTLFVSGVGVSVCGGIQPGVLKLALSAQHFSAGIPARLLFAYPPRIPKEWTEDDIEEEVEARYARLIRGLSTLLPHTDVEDNRFPVALPLASDARSEWVRFYRRFAERQTEADGDLAAAFSKLEGYAARLALLHHVCQSVDAGEEALEAVTVESIRAGIALAEWFAYEAERVYQMLGEAREDGETRVLFERVRKLAERAGGRLTARQLQNSNSRKYTNTEAAAAALESLVGRGLGQWEPVPTSDRGGHPSLAFRPLPTSDTSDTTPDDGDAGDDPGTPIASDTTPPRPTQPGDGVGQDSSPSIDLSATYTPGGDMNPGVVSEVSDVGSEYETERQSFIGTTGRQGGCVGSDGVVSEAPEGVPYTLVTSPAGVRTLADALSGWIGSVGLDTETTGLDPRTDLVRLIQIAAAGDVAIVDVHALPDPLEDLAPLFAALRTKEVVGHNLQFDIRFLVPLGFVPTWAYDTMLASRVLHAGERTETNSRLGHGLGDVLERELDEEIDKSEQRSDWSGTLTASQLGYAARDVAPLVCTADALREKLAAANLTAVADLEMRALLGIAWAAPVRLDVPAWQAIAEEAKERRATLAAEMDDLAPDPNGLPGMASRNWDSPPQVIEAFAHVGVSLEATDDDTLAGLSHPLAEKLREYRGASKKTNTYGAKWVTKHVDRNGHVLPGWNQLGAESGRMSCSNPNLQQIPRGSEYRRCFVAGPGKVLVKADYSQIELRIAAKIANEPVMIRAYQDGRDLHTLTAARLLGKPEAEVKKADRQLAKAVNFGLLYGMGWRSLKLYAKANYGVTLTDEQAQRYRTAFFDAYPALANWHSRVEGQVKALHRKNPDGTHETRTLMDRRRIIPVSKRGSDGSPYPNKQDALNTPVQGTGADGLKLAIALLWERRNDCQAAVPVLFCHDEIVLEVRENEAPAAADWLRTCMVEALAETIAPVPVEVEVTTGRTWGG